MIAINSVTQFMALLSTTGKSLVLFSAEWCKPCKTVKPMLETITAVPVVMVDADQFPYLTSLYYVQALPTVIMLDKGVPVKALTGTMDVQAIMALIS